MSFLKSSAPIFLAGVLFFTQSASAAVTPYVSGEVGSTSNSNSNNLTNTPVRAAAEDLRDPWQADVESRLLCTVGTGDLTDMPASLPAGANYSTTIAGVGVSISSRNVDPLVAGSLGTITTNTVGNSTSDMLQDGAPKPALFFPNGNFWNDTSNDAGGQRDGVLFEFATPVMGFGAWFGDLENRINHPDGVTRTPAIMRFFDASGTQIGSDVEVGPDAAFLASHPTGNSYTEANCGGSNATDIVGCGSGTTRFLGLVADAATPVSKVLVFVGDDDPNEDGSTEVYSFIGPTLATECAMIDLSLTKAVSQTSVTVGQQVTYTVTVSNAAAMSTATAVEVQEALPSGLSFVSATASQGSYNSTTGSWAVGDIAAGVNATLTLVATVQQEGTITNMAQVQAEGGSRKDFDSTVGNSIASEDDQAAVSITGVKAPVEPLPVVDTEEDSACSNPKNEPKNVVAYCSNADGSVRLTWDRHQSGNRTVKIQYQGADGIWHSKEEVEDDGEKIITGLQKGEQYRFRIAYENSCGRSEYSKVAVTVPCAFPDTGAQQDTEIQIGDLLQKTVKVMKIYSILW
jgi:uncharacterized repeat protein (TIGR01451 family)